MRIFLTGSTGFIGKALQARLLARGHSLRCGVRRPPARPIAGVEYVHLDFGEAPSPSDLEFALRDMQAVVNTVGILRTTDTQSFEMLHVASPVVLFAAARRQGVQRVVQVSALGADAAARSGFHRSKYRADQALLDSADQAVVAMPSLVHGPGGRSAGLFGTLALMPLLLLPDAGRSAVQPIHLDDLCEALVLLVEGDRRGRIALVGPSPLALRDFLGELAAGLGAPPPRVFRAPGLALRVLGATIGRFSGGLFDRETLEMLARGNTADAAPITRLLGRPPRAYRDFVGRDDAPAARAQALLGLGLPLLRVSVAMVWLLTAVVSLFVYPREASYSLLAAAGVPELLRPTALVAASAMDFAFGLLSLTWRHAALWLAQIGLILVYTLILSIALPMFWAHPFGPLSKNLPMLAAILILYLHDRRRWTT